MLKFDTVVPIAFKIAAQNPFDAERQVRIACRDAFREQKTLANIIPLIETVLAAGEIKPPEMPPESVPPAIPVADSLGDTGHRSK